LGQVNEEMSNEGVEDLKKQLHSKMMPVCKNKFEINEKKQKRIRLTLYW